MFPSSSASDTPTPDVKLADLEIDQQFDALLVVVESSTQTTKNGSPFLKARLRDRPGTTLDATIFDFTDPAPKPGTVIKVRARIEIYKNARQIRIAKLREVGPADANEWAVSIHLSVGERASRLDSLIAAIENEELKTLAHAVFDTVDVKTQFLMAPAAKLYHSAKVGGLALHTFLVHDIALQLAEIGGRVPIDRALLSTAAILHDIGKIEEFELSAKSGFIPSHAIGHMQGHIVLGLRRIEHVIAKNDIASTPHIEHLMHLIVSHHGLKEWGSPQAPMTIEAVILHSADYAASRVEGANDLIESASSRSEWTEFSKMIGEKLYLGYRPETPETSE